MEYTISMDSLSLKKTWKKKNFFFFLLVQGIRMSWYLFPQVHGLLNHNTQLWGQCLHWLLLALFLDHCILIFQSHSVLSRLPYYTTQDKNIMVILFVCWFLCNVQFCCRVDWMLWTLICMNKENLVLIRYMYPLLASWKEWKGGK